MALFFKHEFSGMGCPCELQFYAESAVPGRETVEMATGEVHRLDQKYSHYRDYSLLSKIQSRAAQAGGTVVDPETAALLDYADTQYRVSGGLFDVTARSLSALWDRITSIPRQDEIDQALGKCGWEQVAWDGRTLEIPAGQVSSPAVSTWETTCTFWAHTRMEHHGGQASETRMVPATH